MKKSALLVLFAVVFVGNSLFSQKIIAIDPDTVTQGQKITMTIEGSGTHFYQIGSLTDVSIRQGTTLVTNCTNFKINNDSLTSVDFTIPYTVSGICSVRVVTTTDGTMIFANSLYIEKGTPPPPAALKSIDPDTSIAGAKLSLLILGNVSCTFSQITTSTNIQIRLGTTNTNADSFKVIDDSTMYGYFSVPVTSGKYDVRVRFTAGPNWLTLAGALTVLPNPSAPVILSAVPDSAFQGAKAIITINAKNTHFDSSAPTMVNLFLNINSNFNHDSTMVVNDTTLISYFTIPGTATISSLYDIRVQNTIDGLITKTDGFKVVPNPFNPALLSIDPDSGFQGQRIWIKINAKFTHYISDKPTATLARGTTNILSDSVIAPFDSVLYARFNIPLAAPVGIYAVRVQNTKDGTLSLANVFTVLTSPTAPALLSIDPDSGYQGQSLWAAIYAKYTHYSKQKPAVALNRGTSLINSDSVIVLYDSVLYARFNIPVATPTGLYSLRVQSTVDGLLTLSNCFTVTLNPFAPKLLFANPNKGEQGTTVNTTIRGRYTNFTSGLTDVRIFLGPVSLVATTYTATDDSTISATFDIPLNFTAQMYNLRIVDTKDGTLNLNGAFLVTLSPLAPQIYAIDPVKAQQGAKVTMIVYAKNTSFTKAKPTSRLFYAQGVNITPDSSTVMDDSTLTVYYTIPQTATVGLWDVIATSTLDGNMIFNDAFEITPLPGSPQILMVMPDSIERGKQTPVMILSQGTNFLTGTQTQVRLIRTGYPNIVADSFEIALDSIMVAYFTIPDTAELGYWTVYVRNSIDGILNLVNGIRIYRVTIGKSEMCRNEIKIYPNPLFNSLNVKLPALHDENLDIQLFDLSGKSVYHAVINTKDNQTLTLDLNFLKTGTYILTIMGSETFITQKVMKSE